MSADVDNSTREAAGAPRCKTPPQVAEYWGVDPQTVLDLIKRGKLRAFTLSPAGCKRPRWHVTPEAIREFEEAHSSQPPSKPARRRRESRPTDYVEYV